MLSFHRLDAHIELRPCVQARRARSMLGPTLNGERDPEGGLQNVGVRIYVLRYPMTM